MDAADNIYCGLCEHRAWVNFEQVAVTEEQIEQYNLPVRETKLSDPRSRTWGDKPSVELDALPAPVLRDLVRESIERHIDPEELQRAKQIEQLERMTLAEVRKNMVPVPNSLKGDGS